jgi:hypothetical protein
MTGTVAIRAPSLTTLGDRAAKVRLFHSRLANIYEAAHARLAANYFSTAHTRFQMLQRGELTLLSTPRSQAATDESYLQTTAKLCGGLEKVVASYKASTDPLKRRIFNALPF